MGTSSDIAKREADEPEVASTSTARGRNNPDVSVPPTPYFNADDLDDNDRNLLIFMSFSSYLDLQEQFLENYKEVLLNRSNKRRVSESVNYDYYKAMNQLIHKQRELFKPQGDEESWVSESDEDGEENPVFTQFLSIYRAEVYIKLMILVFLLKLPKFCYFIITLVYVIYVLLAMGLVTIPIGNISKWRSIKWIIKWVRRIYRIISPLVARARPILFPQRVENIPSSQQEQNREHPPTGVQEASNVISTSKNVEDTGASEHNDPATEPRRNQVAKIPYYKKAFYQLFVSYVLSFLPWWEPNPAYLEETE